MLEELVHFVLLVITTFSTVLLKFKLDAASPILCSFIIGITFHCSNSSHCISETRFLHPNVLSITAVPSRKEGTGM